MVQRTGTERPCGPKQPISRRYPPQITWGGEERDGQKVVTWNVCVCRAQREEEDLSKERRERKMKETEGGID